MVGEGSEIKSGRLCVIQEANGRKMKVQVFVRVYRSCFEHYVVMFKDSKLSLQCGFINLKNCVITKCTGKDTQFRVTLNDFEGTGVVFETSNRKETDEWQEVLQPVIISSSPTLSSISPNLSPVIPRSPLMPTVTEESDEES
ncbi:hypothetical protein DPMN_103173 [Dreissena polymorpha]|uniref:PH domain-containing protein n=1 Tax=Dreissena polymorpha TaxID=45954 RepID=A0A9D4K297_DREPO|nr:hypothetical protein DPMN_103173 [Dreissena polymorpha]